MRKLAVILFFVVSVAFAQHVRFTPVAVTQPAAPTWGGGDLWNFDFEDASLAAFETANGFDHTSSNVVPVISTAQHNTGARSLFLADIVGNQTCYEERALPGNRVELFGSVWVYITVMPVGGVKSIFHAPNTNGDEYFLNVGTTGAVSINGPTQNTSIVTTVGTISLSTWTKVKWHMMANGAGSQWEIILGAETVTATTSETAASFSSIKIGLDNFSGVASWYLDDFSLSDGWYPL